jgi:hypothetical protein
VPATATAPTRTTPPADDKPHCCFIPEEDVPAFERSKSAADLPPGVGCQNDAEFEILDTGDSNPYTTITHSCTEHVGQLLGHSDDGNWSEGDGECWEVKPI